MSIATRIFRVENIAKSFKRFYCNDKPIPALNDTQRAITKKEDNSEKCAKFEERAIKQVTLEKEQDANLRVRLSKECQIIFSSSSIKATAVKLGAVRLKEAINPSASNSWLTYNFNQLEATTIKCPPGSVDIPPVISTTIGTDIPKEKHGIVGDDVSGGSSSVTAGGAQTPMRPVRQEPEKVILTFIPEAWWRAFVPKTGVTGFWTFLLGFGTFLVSKEWYVLEHNYYMGLSWLVMWPLIIKYIGPATAKYLDKEVDAYEKSWNEGDMPDVSDKRIIIKLFRTGREDQKQSLEDAILNELHCQYQMDGQLIVIEAKRENVLLQLEEEYRKRQMMVYKEVKNRLDYHVAVEQVRQRVQHRNLIEYVTREVVKAITPEMQDKLIYYSIDQIMQDLAKEKK